MPYEIWLTNPQDFFQDVLINNEAIRHVFKILINSARLGIAADPSPQDPDPSAKAKNDPPVDVNKAIVLNVRELVRGNPLDFKFDCSTKDGILTLQENL